MSKICLLFPGRHFGWCRPLSLTKNRQNRLVRGDCIALCVRAQKGQISKKMRQLPIFGRFCAYLRAKKVSSELEGPKSRSGMFFGRLRSHLQSQGALPTFQYYQRANIDHLPQNTGSELLSKTLEDSSKLSRRTMLRLEAG